LIILASILYGQVSTLDHTGQYTVWAGVHP
jgi:hypothetical protein